MNILVIRFRQMGDAILATVVLNTLRQNFPEATIDFVLNERLAPLFSDHPSIDHIVTFTDDERHHALTYVRKVWQTVRRRHYDVIIDMRSTMNTALFALLSPTTRYRIGIQKAYTRLMFNYRKAMSSKENMIDHNLGLLAPLNQLKPLMLCRQFSLAITTDEVAAFGRYMNQCGVDANRPVCLVGVTAKLASKRWDEGRMAWVLRRLLERYPTLQLIFNYAPGEEAGHARNVWQQLDRSPRVFMDVQAKSPRELYAMAHHVCMYFGNEGGARHIVHAAGVPSYVIMAPGNNKERWLPQNDTPAEGIASTDFLDDEELATMTRQQQYDVITQERVCEGLFLFIDHHKIL